MLTYTCVEESDQREIDEVDVFGMTKELLGFELMLVGTASVALRCGWTGLGDSELVVCDCELRQQRKIE